VQARESVQAAQLAKAVLLQIELLDKEPVQVLNNIERVSIE
jgi:hypothetical protein